MGPDLWLAAAQNARAAFQQVVACDQDVIHFVTDMVDATRRVLGQKAVDRAVFAYG